MMPPTRWLCAAMLAIASSTTSATPVAANAAPPAPLPLRAAVEAHLAAIAARNMEALLPTITATSNLTMIGPDGTLFDSREKYVAFHRAWFAASDSGRLESEIVRLIEAPTLGHALIRYRYTSRDASGKAQSSANWLALTFALEQGRWRLVFDQNTAIREPAGATRDR